MGSSQPRDWTPAFCISKTDSQTPGPPGKPLITFLTPPKHAPVLGKFTASRGRGVLQPWHRLGSPRSVCFTWKECVAYRKLKSVWSHAFSCPRIPLMVNIRWLLCPVTWACFCFEILRKLVCVKGIRKAPSFLVPRQPAHFSSVCFSRTWWSRECHVLVSIPLQTILWTCINPWAC